MNNEKFSLFSAPIKNTIPLRVVSLGEIATQIRGDRSLSALVGEIRGETDKDKRKEKKGTLLPYCTFGGVFSKRKVEGLQDSSGFICIDIDHISQTGLSLQELKDKLSEDSEIGLRLLFLSPSGDGLKLVCKSAIPIVDDDTYKRVFYSLMGYLSGVYGVKIDEKGLDKQTSSIAQSCYLSYDPDLVFKTSGEFDETRHHYSREELLGDTAPQTAPKPLQRAEYKNPWDDIEEIVRRVEQSGIDITGNQTEWATLGYAFANTLGESGRDYFHRISRFYPGYSERETDGVFNSCLKGTNKTDITHFYRVARDKGIDISVKHKREEIMTPNKPERATQEETRKPSGRDYSEMITEVTPETFRKDISLEPVGVGTRYEFESKDGRERVPLLIPSGSLSLVCAMSGHCKSTFLRNLALNMISEVEGDILYFSFEESKRKTEIRLLNTYIGRELSNGKNTDRIIEYFRTGETQYIKQSERENFLNKTGDFLSLLSSGKLRIYSPDYSAPELVEGVKYYLSTGRRVGAIFVDYIQYLRSGKKTSGRTEEILSIVQTLHDFAKESDIPLILAGQLNRSTKSPVTMGANNIADSADLTRYAEQVINLWYSLKSEDLTEDSADSKKELSRLQTKGFYSGEPGKLYAKITKTRDEGLGFEAVLNFNGKTGVIESNEDLPDSNTPTLTQKTTRLKRRP